MTLSRVVAWLAAVLLLLLPSVAQAQDVLLWHAYRGAEQRALEAAAEAWGERTGTRVNLVAVPFGAFDSRLETAIPRGNGPDLFIAAHASLGKWTEMGLVQPVDTDDPAFQATALQALTLDRLYGLPLAVKSPMLLYDPALIERPPQTTDELIAMARAHTGQGRYGLSYEAAVPYYHAAWVHGFGGQAVDETGEVSLEGEAHQAALAFALRLAVDEGLVPLRPTADRVAQLYREGKAAFVISGPWFVADMDRPVAAAPLPVVSETGLHARPYLTVEAVYLADRASNPDGARAFMAWLAGPEGAQIRQSQGRQPIPRTDVTPADDLLRVQAAQAELAVPLPSDPRVQSVFEAQARALRRVMRGAAAPEAAAIEAQAYYAVLARPAPAPAPAWPFLSLLVASFLAMAGAVGMRLRDAELRRRFREHVFDYLWVAPAGLAVGVLVVVPFVTGATVSLFAHHGGTWTFVGLRHFLDILLARDWPLTSPMSFWYTLVVTVAWTVCNLFMHVSLGIVLAMVLREPWIRMRGIWRALLIIPWAVPNYITALIWRTMFDAQYGAINAMLGLFSGRGEPLALDWFGSFTTAFGANLITNTWLGFPFMMVVTLGALQAIPRELEEAAKVDGAGFFLRFRHVIWPLLKPALLPAIVLGSVWTFNMFNVIYLVSAGEPDGSTEILISEAYRWAFSRGNRYGYAAAYAVLIFFVLLLYTRGANRALGRRVM